MTNHLPECPLSHIDYWKLSLRECICPYLRACEQRVRESEACLALCADRNYQRGLDAARESVAGTPSHHRRSNEDGMGGFVGTSVSHPETFTEYLTRAAVLAAIDALRGDR